MCTVIAISLIFHRKGQERRKKMGVQTFFIATESFVQNPPTIGQKIYAIVLQVVLYERQYHCANNLT